ncbi:hypothetical protein L6261_00505 [Candidatus Parcubacteria bacterium]|nr:hypothetical protein [Candidatus Parcubacteria bacterium]
MFDSRKYFLIFATFLSFLPSFVWAATPTDLESLIFVIGDLLYIVIPVLMSLAVFGFLWGVAMYIWKGSSSAEREKGRDFMFWGIIALFVMVFFWGLVGILKETFFSEDVAPRQEEGIWI